MTEEVNGCTPPAAPTPPTAPGRDQQIRQLVGAAAARLPFIRGHLRALSRDLTALAALSGVDGDDLLVRIESLDRDINDWLHFASGCEHDRHASPATNESPP